MRPTNSALAILWWSIYTVLGIWAQRTLPGIDFFAPGIILSLQEEESGQRTALLGLIWILLVEGTGSLPFGYGLAWYGLLIAFYFMGRWLFEARSFLFIGPDRPWVGPPSSRIGLWPVLAGEPAGEPEAHLHSRGPCRPWPFH